MWYFVSLYLLQVLGYSPLVAGLAFLADAADRSPPAPQTATRLTGRHGRDPCSRWGWR
jgi:hypothetical protein